MPRSRDNEPNHQFGSRKRCLNRAWTIYHNRNHHAPNIWSMEVVKRSATASLQTLPKVVLVKCLWTIKLRLHCLCVKDSRQILLTTDETMYLQWQPFEQMFHFEMFDAFKEFSTYVFSVHYFSLFKCYLVFYRVFRNSVHFVKHSVLFIFWYLRSVFIIVRPSVGHKSPLKDFIVIVCKGLRLNVSPKASKSPYDFPLLLAKGIKYIK